MPELKHPYPAVQGKFGPCYGGCQTHMSKKALRHCGCGLVCGLDLLLYLHRFRPGCAVPLLACDDPALPMATQEYEEKISALRRRWLPIVYPLGTSGLALAWGLSAFFRKFGLPLRTRWAVKWEKLFETIAAMLQQDIPVILAVGQGFPRFWRKEKLTLYSRTPGGEYRPANAARAHFVNVTAMDREWLQVASWGKCYYINREEYCQYTQKHSHRWLCNIVHIQEVV